MSDEQPLDYASAGVDIDRSDSVKQRIRAVVESTFTAGARGAFGGFGGMFRIPADFQRPVLVSSADGVGTKLRVAIEAGRHHTVGHDLVNTGTETLRCVGFFGSAMFTQVFDNVMLPPNTHVLGTPNRDGTGAPPPRPLG